jgi:thiosulfate dehydrogenase (quinone) large subunit
METIKKVFTRPQFTGLFWLILRVYVGYEFLAGGLEKVGSPAWTGAKAGLGVSGFLQGALKMSSGAHPEVQAWYAGLVKNIFLPNATAFSYLVAYGEVLVGVALILGIFTKWSALCGAIMNLAYLAAGTTSSNATMIVIEVAILFAGAGAGYYGVDYFLIPALKKALGVKPAEEAAPALVPVPSPVEAR